MTYLRWAREKLGLGQRQLSRLAQVSQANLSRIERGDTTPSPAFAAKVVPHLQGLVTELHLLYPDRFPIDTPRKPRRKKVA